MRVLASGIAAAALLCLSVPASAAVVSYFGDTNPVYNNAPTNSTGKIQSPGQLGFHAVRFASCTLSSDGQELTLGTVRSQGVYVGRHFQFASSIPLGWSISNNTIGNELRITTRLGSADSREFGMYWYDGTHYANLEFTTSGQLDLLYFNGSQAVYHTMAWDSTIERDYRILLKGGNVGYYADGVPLWQAVAAPSTATPLLVVSDGSGSTISGVGSMRIGEMHFDLAPVSVVPEPASLGLLGAVVAVLARRRSV